VVLPVLVLVLAVLIGLARAVSAELSVQDAAGLGARAAARGEPDAQVRQLVESVVPVGAAVVVDHSGGLVVVRVTSTVAPLGAAARMLPTLTVAARAVALDESDVGVP
jgi:hypothetical protein